MRLSVVLIAPVYLLTQGAAFLLPHSPVRQSALQVQQQSAGDAVKGGIKFLLVPNAKRPVVASSPVEPIVSSTPEPEAIVDAYANLPVPDANLPVPDANLPVPDANLPVPDASAVAPYASPATREMLKSIKLPNLPSIKMPELSQPDTGSPGMTRNLGEYLKSKQIGSFQVNPEKLKSLEAFKAHFSFDNFKNSLEGPNNPVQKMVASWVTLGQLLRSGDTTMGQLAEALNFKELGGWYIGIFSILVAGLVANISGEEKITPSEAVKEAMELLETPVEETTEAVSVEQQIEQLTQATAAVSKELTQIKTEKASRDYEVATLKSDMREMKNLLDSSKITERELKSSLKQTEKKFMTETQQLREELEKRAAAEEELKKKLKDTEDRLKIEKQKVAAAEQKASEEVAEAKAAVEALKAEKNAMEAELDKLAKEAAELAAQLGVEAPKPKKAAPMPKKPAAPKPTFFESVEESVDELPVAKEVVPEGSAKKAKKESKKAAKKAVAKTSNVAADGDWSKLSPSTLKRKTVKDLTEYLQDKGHETTDANGKALKKADLVDAVLSVTA